MSKEEFLKKLKKEIMTIPLKEQTRLLEYYDELIEDQKEEGKNEEQVIAEMEPLEQIANKILADYPSHSKNNVGRTILLVFLSPFLILFAAICFVLDISLWIIIASFYLVDIVIIPLFFLYMAVSIFFLFTNTGVGIFQIGVIFTMVGLAMLFFWANWYLVKAAVGFAKWIYKQVIAWGKEILGYEA